ncbi:type 1 glutamine amidotransferase domain-containing protein [Kineosporia babensis]|uniref:Type 1 glutamine amidotransferase n=1 Tax=Kineosporia babensis TaxID=499548 RepID=A0A9X1SZ30_9ACTN|nr:type 1 glutamine amidotransferase [Kineosporia babensis]
MSDIRNKHVLIISHGHGVESPELVDPLNGLRKAGAKVSVASPGGKTVRTLIMDDAAGPEVEADVAIEDLDSSGFDLLIVPGGTINADALRINPDAVRLANEFANSGRPIASICHGPWLLAEAGLLVGKTMTSWISIRTDVTHAGATWVDQELVEDATNGWTLITSRYPDDLPTFVPAVRDHLAQL